MSHRCYSFAVIFIFLFLLICVPPSCVFALTSANSVVTHTSPATDTVELFKIGEVKETKTITGEDGKDEDNKKITVKSFYSPFIVAADDVMIALAEVNYTTEKGDNEKTELLTQYIETTKGGEKNKWVEKVMKKGEKEENNDWKLQFATKHLNRALFVAALKKDTADAKSKRKNIYFIAINGTLTTKDTGTTPYDFMIVNGTISNDSGAKEITWESRKLSCNSFKEQFVEKVLETSPLAGSTFFVPEKNEFVFAVTGKDNNDGNSNKYISALIEIKESVNKLELLNVTDIADGCYPYFLPWEGKIIMIPTICGDNTNTVMREFNEEKKEWTNYGGPLSRLMKYLKNKRDFTTTLIESHNAILFTEHKEKDTKYDVNLWVSDGKRLKSVGLITAAVDNVTHMDFVYTNGELFSLHNQSKGSENKNILTHLKLQQKKIKDALDAWNNSDAEVSKLCGTEDATATGSCKNNMSTEGIVGWLSNNGTSNKSWADEYLYVNAIVTGGTKVDNGFKFDKVGAGAKWPVGEITDNQPYNFVESGFTLVATVTVDSVGKDNLVLGVGIENKDKKNIIRLLCTEEGIWSVINDKGQTAIEKHICEKGESYKVTLTLKSNENGGGTVYVDGQKLSADGRGFTIEKGSESCFYFYFGADESQNDAETHVTVKNVLLYNRLFKESEVKMLKIPKKDKPKESSEKPANHTDSQGRTQKDKEITGGSSGGDGGSSDTTDKDTKITDMTSSPSQPGDSTVHGGVGTVLLSLLLLFGLHGCYLR